MKTILLIYGILVCTFVSYSQQNPHVIEELFAGKSLANFEQSIGLSQVDYSNQSLIDDIDAEYQLFHDSIRAELNNGTQVVQSDLDANFQQLVVRMQQTFNSGQYGPIPNSSANAKAINGPCENMDFETGDFTGWELTRGDVTGAMPYSYANEWVTWPGPYHTVFNGGNDPVTGIPRVNPQAGQSSVRLGNGPGVGARAARLRQTFLVDASNYMFTYSYAVIFESPANHTLNQLPYFTVRVFDSLGNSVNCGEYSVIADANNAPNYQSVWWAGSNILYQDWQTVFTNLSAYIGQNVTVEFTSGDCSLTGHFGYAYVDATCGIQELSASNDIICTGDSSLLTAPAGAGSYLWSNGATTQSTMVYTGGTYTCTITPFQGGACSVALDITITENPSPTAAFTLSTNTICENEDVVFTDQSTIPPPGTIVGYQWDFGDGIITPIGAGALGGVQNTSGTYLNPTHTYPAAGTYDVQLYVVSADGCEDVITQIVTVNAIPVVVAGPDQTVCEGMQVTLTGAGTNTYAWDNGVMNGIAFTSPVGTTTYTVTGTNASGCQNTDQVDVTVNPLPNVTAGNDLTICEGIQVTLSGAGANTYVWDNGITDGVAFAPVLGTTTYTVTGTDVNGCVNTDQVNVTMNPLPIVNAGPDQIVCAGTQVTLSAAGAATYLWNNGVVDGVPFTPAVGSINYSVNGTDANGCQNTDDVTVTVNPLPVVDAGPDQTLCEGIQVTLNGSGAATYAWNNGITDGIAFTSPIGITTYTVTGTDANGCQNTDDVTITVNPLPIVNAGNNQTVCEGIQVTLNGSGATTYAWDNGILDGTAFTSALGTTTFTVTGTDANGCQNADQVDITVNPLPIVDAGNDQTVCENDQVTLSAVGAVAYVWDNGILDGIAFNPIIGTTIYSVIGTDANGCENSDQVDVTVNPLPIVDAGPDQIVCFGEQVTLNGSGATVYVWDNGGINGVAFTPSLGTTTYSLIGTDANGCVNTDQVDVTANPLPVVNAGPDQSGCENTPITLTATGSSNMIWSSGIINGLSFVQPIGVMHYIAYDTLVTGCSAMDTVRVEIYQNPIVSANDAELCPGEGVILSGNGAVSYSWNNGITDGVMFYPIQTNQYVVTGTDLNGCVGQDTILVSLYNAPVADFKILQLSLTTLDPTTGFQNLSTGAVSYEWDFGDGSGTSTEFEPTHTFPDNAPGEYEIILTAYSAEGCPARAVKYIHVFQDYSIYVPNTFTPDGNGANEIFKPVMYGFDPNDFELLIFNRWGDLIFESHNMEVGWDGTFAGQDFQVQDGVYTWKITAGIEDTNDTKIFLGHVTLLQ